MHYLIANINIIMIKEYNYRSILWNYFILLQWFMIKAMKNRILLFCVFLSACMLMVAQNVDDNVYMGKVVDAKPIVAKQKQAMTDTMALPVDESLGLPLFNSYNALPMSMPMYSWGGYNLWSLHPGLNASFGMSVTVGLGKNSYPGAGFAHDLALMYATKLSGRFTLAVGGYYNHLSWNGADYHDAGVSAVLGYHIDDRWDACVYGQKSLLAPRMPRPLMDMGDLGDKIGAMVTYKITPSASISVSVETSNRPQKENY
jgi:hypothetical protein